jgi:hypothetical protein
MVQAAKKAYGQSASLDCHLTQALVQRFMKGDDLSDDLLADVEKHLAVCADCMAVAKGTSKPMSQRKEMNPMVAQALAVIQQPKHLMMLGGLAVVLVLMGTVLRNPTAMLGPKVGVAKADKEERSEEPEAKATESKPHEESKGKDEPEAKQIPSETPAATVKETTTESPPVAEIATSALEGLQSADPETVEAAKPPEPTPKVNEGTPEQQPKHTDVIVVRESAPAPKAVRRVKPKAKPKLKAKAKPVHVANPVKKETVKVAAPRKAAPKTSEVKVYDEHGRLMRP